MRIKDKKKIIFIPIILILLFILYFFNNNTINIIRGDSMYPTLKNNELFLTKNNSQIDVGDIVVFETPLDWDDSPKLLIKRVLAKQGDKVEIKGDSLYINNKKILDISNDYYSHNDKSFVIDKDYYFLIGDNTPNSRDSLFYMINYEKVNFLINKKQIVGVGKKDSEKKEIYRYVETYNKQK